MKLHFAGRIFLICLLLIFIFPAQGKALEIGGKMEVMSGLFYGQDEFKASIFGEGELEFFLPGSRNLDARLILRGRLLDEEPELGLKYLYLRYQKGRGNITLGRQPVSWSYGAMLNPLDYRFGIEDLGGQTITPEIDGIRYFYSFGEGISLQLATDFPEVAKEQSLDRLGYGGRFRLLLRGHDLSLNLSVQPVDLFPEENFLRGGITYSGDVGPLGIYGAFGYYRFLDLEKEDLMVQLGVDYSLQVGPEYDKKPIYFQAEYMRFLKEELPLYFLMLTGEEQEMPAAPGNTQDQPQIFDLLLVSTYGEINPFTRLGTAVITGFGEQFFSIQPFYESDLGGGVDFMIYGNLSYANDDEWSGGVRTGLSYYF